VEADAAAAVGLDDPAVGEHVEADRLAQVGLCGDLGLLVVGQDGGAAVAVDRVALRSSLSHLYCHLQFWYCPPSK
jgi:hypothetical protein